MQTSQSNGNTLHFYQKIALRASHKLLRHVCFNAASTHITTLHAEVSTISPVHALQPLKFLQQVLQKI